MHRSALLLSVARLAGTLLASLPVTCLAQATLSVDSATVMHDGRSILIEASDTDPGYYGAVDWFPGWSNNDKAQFTVVRGGNTSTFQIVFTGATIHVVSGTLHWEIYAYIPDGTKVVIPGDSIDLSSDAGWLQDSASNVLASTSGYSVTNYSLVGTDGFIDESSLSFDDTVYVDLTSGTDWTKPPYNYTESAAWTAAHSSGTALKHLNLAVKLWNDGAGSYAGGSCAIRVKRGTSGDEEVSTTNINRSGSSFTSPLLISTYGSGDRPHITYPGDTGPWNGINRSGGGGSYARGDFVYINGLYLENTFSGDRQGSVGITLNDDSDHFVVSDCIVQGFSNNITLQPLPGNSYSRWWSVFRNIIIDAHSDDNPQGLFSAGCKKGFVISQNVVDNNGYGANGTDRNTFRHNLYLAADETTVGPFVWGNLISRGGAFGCRTDAGGAIYGNIFAENALGSVMGATEYRGGGRTARNYFEHAEDLTLGDTPRGWGPGVAGPFGPSIMELNCVTSSDGSSPLAVRVEQHLLDLLNNPGFEDDHDPPNAGFGDWTWSGDGASIDTSVYRSAPASALFAADGSSGTTVITQGPLLGAYTGDPVHVEFYLMRTGGTTYSVTVQLNGSTLATLTSVPTSWTRYHYDTTASANTLTLTLTFHNDTGTFNLDDAKVNVSLQPFALEPEVLVRNNTGLADGPFAPNVGVDIMPVVTASRNCWDARPSSTDYTMWINPWATSPLLLFSDYKIIKSGRAGADGIEINDTNPDTTLTLSARQTTPYYEDAHSVSTTPTYANSGYDLGSYAHDLGFTQQGMYPDPIDYYTAVRARAIRDNTANLIDFVAATAHMMAQYEVTSPTISGGPMPFYGSGDGSDPQLP